MFSIPSMKTIVWNGNITYGFVISIVSAIVINRINYLFPYFPSLYPQNLQQSDDWFRQWKWRNFIISFFHSAITGVGSLLCVIYSPRLLIDVIDEYLEAVYLLTSLSHGYFIYDLIEMATHLQYKGSKELVLHHILILSCFSLTVTQQKYCGYSSIALLIEMSNIFLHFRQLLLIAGTPKSAPIYKFNSKLNIIMFALIRTVCLFWLWVTLLWVLPRVPLIHKLIAFVTLLGIGVMTYVLFVRIYNSDFSQQTKDRHPNGQTVGANQSTSAQSNDSEPQSNGLVINPNDIHSKMS